MAQQLSFSYAANVRAAVPAHLHLTSVAGRMGGLLRQQLSGLDKWLVTRSEEAYLDLYAGRTDQLVYLTAGTEPCRVWSVLIEEHLPGPKAGVLSSRLSCA